MMRLRSCACVLLAMATFGCTVGHGRDINLVLPLCHAPPYATASSGPAWPQRSGYSTRPEDAPTLDSLMAWLGGNYVVWRVTTEGALNPVVHTGQMELVNALVAPHAPVGQLTIDGQTLPVYLDFAPNAGRLELSTARPGIMDGSGAFFLVSQLGRQPDRWMLGGRWFAASGRVVVPRERGVVFFEQQAGYFCAVRSRTDT